MELQVNNPIQWYKYQTPKVRILWKGKPQPMGIFYSAIEALEVIKKNTQILNEIKEYTIYTPDGLLNHSNFNL